MSKPDAPLLSRGRSSAFPYLSTARVRYFLGAMYHVPRPQGGPRLGCETVSFGCNIAVIRWETSTTIIRRFV
jgi:hypothetical protein